MRNSATASALATSALGLIIGPFAHAATLPSVVQSQGGTACWLSIPTTDTKVRAKAIGFRNEGTTSAFIICAVPTPDKFTDFYIAFLTIDGGNHAVNCTAVNGGAWDPIYVSKSIDTQFGPNTAVQLYWNASDFGGTAGNNLPSGYMSVTCNLPPQVSVQNVYIEYRQEIGS